MGKSEKSYTGWWFLSITAVISVIIFLIRPDVLLPSLSFFLDIIKKIIFIFIFIFILLVLVNYLVKPEWLIKYMGKGSGWKGWLFALVGGIILTGPIYMWYPLLNDLQKKGVRNGLMATFLYNRAIKPALLPLMVFYFGVVYVIILTAVMLVISLLQGIIVEKIVDKNRDLEVEK
jgi:uncharacterized membrane protein YraQ (UPF0718 family)